MGTTDALRVPFILNSLKPADEQRSLWRRENGTTEGNDCALSVVLAHNLHRDTSDLGNETGAWSRFLEPL